MDDSTALLNGSPPPRQADMLEAIRQVRNVVQNSALDCGCRDRVSDAIQRLETLERKRAQKRLRSAVREQKRKISSLLSLLGDFDMQNSDSFELGVLMEASLLLLDIAAEASAGSGLVRSLLLLERHAEEHTFALRHDPNKDMVG